MAFSLDGSIRNFALFPGMRGATLFWRYFRQARRLNRLKPGSERPEPSPTVGNVLQRLRTVLVRRLIGLPSPFLRGWDLLFGVP